MRPMLAVVRASMITGLAHTALHVADVDAAVAWYRDVLGLTVLSPPYRMEGDAIDARHGRAGAVAGRREGRDRRRRRRRDRVIEVIEYPNVDRRPRARPTVDRRSRLHARRLAVRRRRRDPRRARGARACASSSTGVADVAGLRTTWFADPWDNVFILVEKVRHPDRPYYRQY